MKHAHSQIKCILQPLSAASNSSLSKSITKCFSYEEQNLVYYRSIEPINHVILFFLYVAWRQKSGFVMIFSQFFYCGLFVIIELDDIDLDVVNLN